MGTGKLLGIRNKLRGNDLRWTSILFRGSRNTLSRFMLQKTGIGHAAMTQSAPRLHFFLFLRAVKPTLKSFDHFTTPRFVFDEMVKLNTHIITFISHRLTFEQFYWLFQVTWYKIGGRVSRNTPRPKRYLSSDFWITIKKRTHSVFSVFIFS